MKTALITSTGSVAADITLKSLKRMGFRVVGCNIYPKEWIVESCEMDVFYQAPPVSDQENYLAFMKDLCVKEKVEYLLPMIDYEIDLLNCNREWFEEQGVTLCMSPKESLDIIRNKKRLQSLLKLTALISKVWKQTDTAFTVCRKHWSRLIYSRRCPGTLSCCMLCCWIV